ncbi:DUF2306 domain-containing protein [uncultured Tateyamaria sp.]|uniref:DUF2306 domain-containing protein n=1 Tax=Tateyamaria sp. 1078 TaxID=3417464 RepID=UPI00260FC8F9|nr:DUF2306 domain-containing protein [uncultured Tateyamaria sp.]
MVSLRTSERVFLAFMILYSIIPALGGLVRVIDLTLGTALMPANPRALATPLPIVLHICTSFVFCIFGALQFLPSLRPGLHRKIGPVVALSGGLAAATGLWMTVTFPFPETLQGPALFWVRMVLGTTMIALIGTGLFAARRRSVLHHRAAMICAYAIGQGASTQGFFGITWMIAASAEPTGIIREALMISAWAFNLAVALTVIWMYGARAHGTAGGAPLAAGQTASDRRL